jgi:predicted RNA-binding Zn-ribbon protein involved in translation (DUF1610 family)
VIELTKEEMAKKAIDSAKVDAVECLGCSRRLEFWYTPEMKEVKFECPTCHTKHKGKIPLLATLKGREED